MTEDAECLNNGPVDETAMPEGEILATEEGLRAETAMSEEEMAAMEEELLNEDAMAAGAEDDMPSPEEMLTMEEAMREAEMNVEQEDLAPPSVNESMAGLASSLVRPVAVGTIDTGALEAHPLADLLPRMNESEFADLRESIETDGLQNAIIVFQGRILDGRNRYQACKEPALPIAVFEFVGTEQQALTYVLASNQHRRKLTPSQRAVVALESLPMIAGDVNLKRIEKIRETKRRQAFRDTLEIVPKSDDEAGRPISSRVIAADMMGVNDSYIGHAKRIKQADPELYRHVWAGRVTIPEALRKLDGITDDPRTVRAKTVRRDIAKLLRDPDEHAEFLDRLEALVAEFAQT